MARLHVSYRLQRNLALNIEDLRNGQRSHGVWWLAELVDVQVLILSQAYKPITEP